MSLFRRMSYAARVLPAYGWQRLTRRGPDGHVHLIMALADHFEPAIDARGGAARVGRDEQTRRLELWCREYPQLAGAWRDHDGRPFVHSYFFPAEQYDEGLVQALADHCHAGWGEIEIHLHHGNPDPDTAQNTRQLLTAFRDVLAFRHQCLAMETTSNTPRYAFVHGNFALANSAGGEFCGVDSEMSVLAQTGCFADMTLPTAPLHPSQTAKINSLYECSIPLDRRAPQRRGRDLKVGRIPKVDPLIVQGPLLVDFGRKGRVGVENGSITKANPLTVSRLKLWKKAAVQVEGRPDWLFIKLHCHSMAPSQKEAVLGEPMRRFLEELVQGAAERNETLHFVSAREMVNIIHAACEGREGNPNDYRDYKFRRIRDLASSAKSVDYPSADVRA
ncbi:MAG TPA: hypothetical protein VFO46_12830 [Candidatus Sulfotelmatobacter sp.]|nr:hypothetical protein [Candidatus Sulfotelmatobacter sp.]